MTKPIKQSDLLDAIVSLFARHGSEVEVATTTMPAPTAKPLRILLARTTTSPARSRLACSRSAGTRS